MLPHILQPQHYGTPVAALTIDGLVVCCFNRDLKKWELAFLRDAHDFQLSARRVNLVTGEIVAEADRGPVREDAKLIELNVSGGSNRHFEDFAQGHFRVKPDFVRLQEDESYDYRWVVDATSTEVTHGDFVDFAQTASEQQISLVTVPNALFYTKRVTQESIVFARQGVDPATGGTVFGRTNELIGAAVYASAPGTIELKYADTGEPVFPDFEMSFTPGFFYDIFMMNMDQGDDNVEPAPNTSKHYLEGDFDCLYKLFDFDGNKVQNFAPVDGDLRTSQGDCHGTGMGGGGRAAPDSLLPLVQPE